MPSAGIDIVLKFSIFPARTVLECTKLTDVYGTGRKVCTITAETGTKVCIVTARTGIDVIPCLPNFPVPVLISYQTFKGFRYR